jgi:hypothetical protein
VLDEDPTRRLCYQCKEFFMVRRGWVRAGNLGGGEGGQALLKHELLANLHRLRFVRDNADEERTVRSEGYCCGVPFSGEFSHE